MKKNAGYIVETKSGKRGRTFHHKGLINGKLPVYLEKSKFVYEENAILCDPHSVKQLGFID